MKLREKTKKKIRGSITVLLVIILLPMMTFSALIVDMSRINMAKAMMSSAGDLTMNSALANYDTILKDVYGLFAMSQEKTEAELAEELTNYFAQTLTSYGIVEAENSKDYVKDLIGDFTEIVAGTEEYSINTSNFLELEDITLKADKVDTSSLANSSILRNQIVEYMKFRAPLEFGMSFLDALKSFDVVNEQMEVVEAQVDAQESTQDVTQACKKLIKLIREYDKLVDSLNTSVTGLNNSTDGQIVYIKDYSTQVDKYFSDWGENYTHINLLNMVFQAKAPSIDAVYLVKLNYKGGTYFVKANGAGLNYTNSGIPDSVVGTKAATTAEAKTQTENQIANLNGNYKTFASTYLGKHYIDGSYLQEGLSAFSDESKAIDTFIEYEKFLQDQADVKYTDVAKTLEQIYILGKYFDNYNEKITAEVNEAYREWQADVREVNRINGIINGIGTTLGGYITNINDTAFDYIYSNAEVACLKSVPALQSRAVALLDKELPDLTGSYTSYYSSHLKNSAYGNVYKSLFNSIVTNNTMKKSEEDICNYALKYLSYNGKDSFAEYMRDKVGLFVSTNSLYQLLNCLLTLSDYCDSYQESLNEYDQAKEDLEAAVAEEARTEGIYDAKYDERKGVTDSYKGCLKGFYEFGKAFQEDAYHYGRYITTAQNIISREAAAVKTQFGKICDNINQLKTKLENISAQIGVVEGFITTYNGKLDTLDQKNKAYVSKNNGSDSFSEQTNSDLESSRSDYDLDSLRSMKTAIAEAQSRYTAFYTYLCGDVYFKYGGKRLHEITNASDVKAAAASNIQSITESIVTREIAATSLTQLYKKGPGHTFNYYVFGESPNGYQKFLDPVIQMKFLKYLNGAYPETATSTIPDGEGGTKSPESVESDYKTTKNSLKNGSGASVEDVSDDDASGSGGKDKYGYSYAGATVSTDGLPSKGTKGKEVGETQYTLAEEEPAEGEEYGKVNAKGGVTDQKNVLTKILGNLGDVLSAGIENAYILTYIFENFSYNTMIQDAVMEGQETDGKLKSGSEGAKLSEAKGYLKDSKILEKYVDKMATLSNVTKRAENNYLYGAEIEYILYGNTNPSKNVTYAKASIYAIRFAFNCIFAFTNSEIRNTTMTAGLAVQAATMGIVPYQIVQIVLQLALAAAESAMDLDMMNSGLDVAVVKTADTWMLSVSSGIKMAGSVVAEAGADLAGKAINSITGGLQGVVDAAAGELTGAIEDLKTELQHSAEAEVEKIADQIASVITDKVEEKLNDLQFIEAETKQALESQITQLFDQAETEINNKLNEVFAGNKLAQTVLESLSEKKLVASVLGGVKGKITTVIADIPGGTEAVQAIVEQITSIKTTMVTKVTDSIQVLLQNASSFVTGAVEEVHGQLDAYIGQAGEDISEEAAKSIREGVTNVTNNFVGNYMGEGKVTGGGGKTSLASLIRFGYKEYMMLFVYIAICAGGTESNGILLRTADVIQMNIQKAGTGASFKHNKGSEFLMSEAYTYISVSAEAKLDMFFMDLDLFASVVEEPAFAAGDGSEATADTGSGESDNAMDKATTIKYKGLLGY